MADVRIDKRDEKVQGQGEEVEVYETHAHVDEVILDPNADNAVQAEPASREATSLDRLSEPTPLEQLNSSSRKQDAGKRSARSDKSE